MVILSLAVCSLSDRTSSLRCHTLYKCILTNIISADFTYRRGGGTAESVLWLIRLYYVSPPPGRHIGLLWFAVSRRRRRRLSLWHFAENIQIKALGLGLSYYPILVTEGVQRPYQISGVTTLFSRSPGVIVFEILSCGQDSKKSIRPRIIILPHIGHWGSAMTLSNFGGR